jgi:hypothetical protein
MIVVDIFPSRYSPSSVMDHCIFSHLFAVFWSVLLPVEWFGHEDHSLYSYVAHCVYYFFPSQSQDFSPDFFTAGSNIVQATMDVYKAAMDNLLPTPAKSHYVFNLRDFSRVILGCCLIRKDQVENKKVMAR